jgi:hypothetical protein
VIKANAPEILTGIGAGGVVATSYLTAKASYKASEVIHEREDKEGTPFDSKERFKERTKLVWKLYIPPVASGAITIVCIVASQKTAGRRTSAAIAAYSITEKAFSEYKEKVIEEIGSGKEQKIRDKIAQDKVDANPSKSKEVVIVAGGHVLFQESLTGRYFRTDMESLNKSVNQFNHLINNNVLVALSEFYDLIGLEPTSQSSEIGWSSEKLMELCYHAVVDADAGEPVIVFDYNPLPKAIWS